MNGAMTQPASYAMNDQQLLRYARHLLLDNVGVEGQNQILGAHALVIGAGGLGSPVALYLASAGVGHLTLVDHDRVDSPICNVKSPTPPTGWACSRWTPRKRRSGR